MRSLACLVVASCSLSACSGLVQLTPAQRMELIERLDKSAAFARACGLGKSEMRVRFVALPDGTIAEPVVVMGEKGTPEKARCVLDKLRAAKLSPHDHAITVRTERLLPTGKAPRTDAKLMADSQGIKAAVIDKRIADATPSIEACYAKKRAPPTSLHGQLTVFFLIAPDGKVTDVLVESMLHDAEVEWCVLDAFRALHFDKPAGGGYVEAVHLVTVGD